MSFAIDIILGTNNDLPIEENNFNLGNSDDQHIRDCFISFPGWWKQFPSNGVGVLAYQLARINTLIVLNKVKQQLKNDGYQLSNPTVQLINGNLKITPNAYRP